MEFDIADLLIDYVNYDGPKNVLIQWEQFSARPRHALQRAFFNNGLIESAKSKGFLYSEIQPFQIYEFLDQKGVGTPTLDTLVEELQLALNDIAGSPEEFMLDKQNLPENELLKLTSEIRGSLTIEELVELFPCHIAISEEQKKLILFDAQNRMNAESLKEAQSRIPK